MEKTNEQAVEQQPTLNTKFFQRARTFFKKHGVLFGAPIIVLCIYTAALFAYGLWPFSDLFTIASYDLSAQIVPFIEHLFDVIDGKSTLTYSYAIIGGADVTGTFLYFFISPFSFLFLILGDGMVSQACSIVMGLKLTAIAFAGSWFAKKQFKNIPDFWCIAIGVVYAYCGYTFVSCTYINWMDFLIYLPFCCTAFIRMEKTGKYLAFAALMACCVYTCFSIACFSMLTVFPILIVYALLCKEKGKKLSFVATICLSFVVAILLALPLLFPALMAYLTSGRNDEGLFHNIWFGFSRHYLTGELGNFSAEVFIKHWSESLYRKWSYVFSDTLFLVLTVIWFFRVGLKSRFAKFMLFAGILTLIPVLVDESMLLLNMGSYMSYALRFGFLNAFYLLGGACLCLSDIYTKEPQKEVSLKALWYVETKDTDLPVETEEKMQNDGGMYETNLPLPTETSKRKLSVWAIVFTAISAAVALFLVWYITAENYLNIWINEGTSEDLQNGLRSFSPRYAHSEGGLEVIGVWFTLISMLGIVGYILYAKRKLGMQLLSFILLFVVSVQAIFYNNQIVVGNRSTQHTDVSKLASICQTLNEKEDSYFRVKDYGDKFVIPAPFIANCNSFGVFSSVIDRDNFEIKHLFGYAGNGTNTLKSAHDYSQGNRCEEFGDSFLGYKYFVVHESQKDSLKTDHIRRAYVKPVMVENEEGVLEHMHVDEFYVFENEIVFPSAYRVSSGNFSFVAENNWDANNRKLNQAALYEYLRGKTLAEMKKPTKSNSDEYVTPKTARELSEYLWSKAAQIEVGAGEITAKTTAEKGEYLFLNFVASKGYEVTVNGKKATLQENDLHFLCVALEEGKNTVVFTYKSPYVTYALYGIVCTLFGLLMVVIVVERTKIWQRITPVIAWAGVGLATALCVFYFVFPTGVWLFKLLRLLI